MNIPEINSLNSIIHGSKILIYGAGGGGAKLFELIAKTRPDICVQAFLDTNKYSGVYLGRQIINVDSAGRFPRSSIIVAS